MKVLGIETSCDDTGVAIYDSQEGLLINRFSSQIDIHKIYGGVVPELAARDHIRKVMPLIESVLEECNLEKSEIDAVAYTAGPGLVGALLVGATVGRSLAMALNIRAIGVHHMEGHLLSPMLENEAPQYPFLSLLVSGGHTMLVDVRSLGSYELLGETRDDAVGEAFDKFASVLGLPYPGGPSIEKCAMQGRAGRFKFPKPMSSHSTLDFSFSGLKTHAFQEFRKFQKDNQTVDDQTRYDFAYAFQDAAIDALVVKLKQALKKTGYSEVIIAGGVGANKLLRQRVAKLSKDLQVRAYFPSLELCADNGAMIAYTGYLRLMAGYQENLDYAVYPRWSLESLEPMLAASGGTGQPQTQCGQSITSS